MVLSRQKLRMLSGLAVIAAITGLTATTGWAHDPDTPAGRDAARRFLVDREPASKAAPITGAAATPCVNGTAAGYPCKSVDLLSVLPMSSIGGGQGNDIWGWTDQLTGKEYALMGRTNGTAFVDISTPTSPVYLGNLSTHSGSAPWRDVKVYKDHAFIVADVSGHGMQVFDLTRLRNVASPQTFTADKHYANFGNSHNIAINEATGYAYAVGSNTCGGGPHMVDIRTPKSPVSAGCVAADGYTHDTQCVVYHGPDTTYTGRELCFNANEDTLTIVDVTNKATPKQVVRKTYTGSAYSHQGWLTEDHKYFLLDDELDEQNRSVNTQTYIWNVQDLDAPVNTGNYTAPTKAIDHNQYVLGNYSYQANYRAGLRIIDISKVATAQLSEAAYFDIYPADSNASFNGAWSTYPYFPSGNVVVSGIEQGLFVLKPQLGSIPPPTGQAYTNGTDVAIPDRATVLSEIPVTGRTGNASSAVKVDVAIRHSYRGDLAIDVIAPDGTAYRVKNASSSDGADNVIATYTIDASSETINGTWKLRIQDLYSGDTGTLDTWTITL